MSSKIKWRESFQKVRSQSQGSSEAKTSSLLEEGDLSVSDEELEIYLGTLKKKSGVGRLWLGNTFDKIIDRTPNVSISSVSDGEGPTSEQEKTNYSDNDFLPNILALPQATEAEKSAASEASSIKPMEAVHMISDFELSDGPLELDNNVKLTLSDHRDLDVAREVKSVGKVLSEDKEPSTSEEVEEEIEEDAQQLKHSESVTSSISFALSEQELLKKPSDHIGQRSSNSSQHSSHHRKHHGSHHRKHHGSNRSPQLSSRHHRSISNHSSSRPNSRKSSQKEHTSSRKSDHSYTDDFSKSSKEYSDSVQETLHSVSSYTSSVSANVKSKHLSKRASKKLLIKNCL